MENCPNNKTNKCNCTYPCSRKGKCCDCLAYHRKQGELPACYFDEEKEKTYNRTIEFFIDSTKNTGFGYLN